MTWLRRVRPALFVLGAGLLVATLFGARALTAGNGQDGPKSASQPPPTAGKGGPVVMGTVDSDTPGFRSGKFGRVSVRLKARRAMSSGVRLSLKFALGRKSSLSFFASTGV